MNKEFLSNFWKAFLAFIGAFALLFGLPFLAACLFGDIVGIIAFFFAIAILAATLVAAVVT